MADIDFEHQGSAMESEAPVHVIIPEQAVAAGKEANLDLGQYFLQREGENLSFAIAQFPEGLQVDENTGLVTGLAPNLTENKLYLVNIRATSSKTQKSSTVFFNLLLVGAELLDTQDAKIAFGEEDVNFWEMADDYELQKWIQHIVNEHFAAIFIHNGDIPFEWIGELVASRKAKSGWTVYNFENCIAINAGEMAYEDGNRGRLLRTLEEIYKVDVPAKAWLALGIGGTDLENIGRAWMVAKRLNMAVSDQAPTEIAALNFDNFIRVIQTLSVRKPKP